MLQIIAIKKRALSKSLAKESFKPFMMISLYLCYSNLALAQT